MDRESRESARMEPTGAGREYWPAEGKAPRQVHNEMAADRAHEAGGPGGSRRYVATPWRPAPEQHADPIARVDGQRRTL